MEDNPLANLTDVSTVIVDPAHMIWWFRNSIHPVASDGQIAATIPDVVADLMCRILATSMAECSVEPVPTDRIDDTAKAFLERAVNLSPEVLKRLRLKAVDGLRRSIEEGD